MDGPSNCPNCLKKLAFSASYAKHKLVCPFRSTTSPITKPLLSGSNISSLQMTIPKKHTMESLEELLVKKRLKLPSDDGSEDEDAPEIKPLRNTKSAVKSVQMMDPESEDMRSTKTAVKSVRIMESESEVDDEFVVKPIPEPKASNNRRVPVSLQMYLIRISIIILIQLQSLISQ